MDYHAVIFDLDGTLANTLEDIADTMNRVLAYYGFPIHNHEAYRFYVGNGLKNLVTRCLPDKAQVEEIIERCHQRMTVDYEQNYIVKTRLYEGIPELLDALSRHQVKLAVLSNKADPITQKICDVLLSPWKFEVIMGANAHFPRKPNAEAALFIARQMGVGPENICYLGDSDVDMLTARNAGFFPVGVSWGFRPKEELITSGAQRIIDTPMELLEFF